MKALNPLMKFSFGILCLSQFAFGADQSPEQAIKKYIDAIMKGDMKAAINLIARFAGRNERNLLQEITESAQHETAKSFRSKPIASKIDGELAVVVVQEKPKDIDPVYLIKQQGHWRLLPDFDYEDQAGISEGQIARYEKLKAWFEEQEVLFKAKK
jgi:hypothetical protein